MGILRSTLLDRAGFLHGLPERGVPDLDLLAALAVEQITQVAQVHGARVVDAREAAGQEADAIVARFAGLPIAVGVRVADCVPVLFADEGSGAVAAVHAGWRGVVGGVVRAAALKLAGSALVVAIGPCIGACCFEVGQDVAAEIAFSAPGANVVLDLPGGKARVDLRAAVRAQLRALGVADARIEDVPGCTKHETRFHSFRRDGARSGRMLAAIACRSPLAP